MKSFLCIALVAAFLTLPVVAAQAAAKPAPATPAAPPPPPPKSSFVIDPKFGKDPFFPSSIRIGKVPLQPTNDVVTPPPVLLFPEDLRCQGVAASGTKRLGIVNGRTVEAGERWTYRTPTGQTNQIHCLEVRDRSVLLEVNGITKELHINSKFR